MTWTLDDLKGKACAKLNPHLIQPPPAFDRVAKREDFDGAKTYAAEKNLQAACERVLEERGYKRLTAKNAGEYASGWFGHLNKPIGNPLMPDLFVIRNGRILQVELKVRNKFQPGQADMIRRGEWVLCRSLDEFRAILDTWQQEIKEQQSDSGKD